MTPTQRRDRATRLASRDNEAALETARQVTDPWFECQALAWVARFGPTERFDEIVEESIAVGRASSEPYQAVAATAWPIRACVERGRVERLSTLLPSLLGAARHIQPVASRSEAVFLLFQAIFPAGRQMWAPMLDALVEASTPVSHWRQARNLVDAALIVASEAPEFACTVVARVEEPKIRARIERALSTTKMRPPRPFFWQHAA